MYFKTKSISLKPFVKLYFTACSALHLQAVSTFAIYKTDHHIAKLAIPYYIHSPLMDLATREKCCGVGAGGCCSDIEKWRSVTTVKFNYKIFQLLEITSCKTENTSIDISPSKLSHRYLFFHFHLSDRELILVNTNLPRLLKKAITWVTFLKTHPLWMSLI